MPEPPLVSRPWMAGYGVVAANEGSGLLPWSWAEERLAATRHCWVATTWSDGRPHLSPVWSVWLEDCLWFSCGVRSRKASNLAVDPRCTLSTDDPLNPVVVSGEATLSPSPSQVDRFVDTLDEKYGTTSPPDLRDPAVCATVRVRAVSVIALRSDDFTGTPTRWTFQRPTLP